MASLLDQLEANLEKGKETHQSQNTTSVRKLIAGLEIKGRLLPYMMDGQCRFLETFYHHGFVQSANGSWFYGACPKNFGWEETCGLCDSMRAHYDEFNSDNIYNNYKRKRRYWVNFFVTDIGELPNFKPDAAMVSLWKESIGEVIRLEIPFTVKEKIDGALEEDELGTKIFNPIQGFDLRIKVTEKKTQDKVYPNYDQTTFAREATPLPGIEGKEALEAVLAKCENLRASIETQTNQDREPLRKASEAEGFGGDDGNAPSQQESTPAGPDQSVPGGLNEGVDASATPPADDTPEATEGGSLADIFSQYRE